MHAMMRSRFGGMAFGRGGPRSVSCAVAAVLVSCTASWAVDSKFAGNIYTNSGIDESLFLTYWNQVTPENAGKWGGAEPQRDNMDWGTLDNMFAFARANGLPVKQHTFVWGNQQPGWIDGLSATEQKAEVEEWIRLFCERYPDVDSIDVVNEPLHAKPSYRGALGGDGATGWDWVIWTFEKARQYAPNAKLLINDYNILNSNDGTTNYITIIQLLKDRGLIDGIGCQGHFMEGTAASTIENNLNRLAALGLPIYISELDVDLSSDANQLSTYQRIFPILWDHPSVAGITFWGYREGKIWQANAYLLRSDGTERPALTWLMDYMNATPPPPQVSIDSFTANPSIIAEGQSSTLSWSTSNADSASIDQSVGTVNVNGSQSVSPAATTTYTLTAQGDGGPKTQQVTVTIGDPTALHLRINCGDNTVAEWENDGGYASAGDLFTFGGTPNTSGVADAAPGEVYHTCRHNDPAYSISVQDGTYLVRIHFYDEYGDRSMNVDIEGQTRLTGYGFPTDTAVVEDIAGVEVSDGNGMQVVFSHTAGEDSFCSGIEIIGGASTDPTISVVAPEAGSVWYVGTTPDIKWTAANVSEVSVSYSTDGSTFAQIDGSVDAALGGLSWTVPDEPSTQCTISIEDTAGAASADSGVFEIRTVTDDDIDGMDDGWETDYFGDLSHDGTADTDGDGTTDLDEFMAATDPTVHDGGGDGGGDGDDGDSGCGTAGAEGGGAALAVLALVLVSLRFRRERPGREASRADR